MEETASNFLNRFLSSLPPEKRKRYRKFDSYSFCADRENANACVELILKGEKRATASLARGYAYENEPLSEPGRLDIITNWEKIPRCIIEIISVETKPFAEVDSEFAFEEGEGDKSLEHWKKEHRKFFSEECKAMGITFEPAMLVILERFKVVYQE